MLSPRTRHPWSRPAAASSCPAARSPKTANCAANRSAAPTRTRSRRTTELACAARHARTDLEVAFSRLHNRTMAMTEDEVRQLAADASAAYIAHEYERAGEM